MYPAQLFRELLDPRFHDLDIGRMTAVFPSRRTLVAGESGVELAYNVLEQSGINCFRHVGGVCADSSRLVH